MGVVAAGPIMQAGPFAVAPEFPGADLPPNRVAFLRSVTWLRYPVDDGEDDADEDVEDDDGVVMDFAAVWLLVVEAADAFVGAAVVVNHLVAFAVVDLHPVAVEMLEVADVAQ